MVLTTYLNICWSNWIIIHRVGFKIPQKNKMNRLRKTIQVPNKVHPIKFATEVHGIHGTSIAGTNLLTFGLDETKGYFPQFYC